MNGYGVIFDMDGVLVDSYQAHYHSWLQTAQRYGLSMNETDFKRTFGRTSREIIGQLWPGRFNDQQIREFDAIKEKAYRDVLLRQFPAMDGVGELLEQLARAGFALAIGSSGPPENVALARRLLPNGDLIGVTVDGSEVQHGKPDPQVFLTAARKLSLPPGCCAVVEDAPVGIEAARRAGMTAIAITGTVGRDALARRAHIVVDSLRQLTPKLIEDAIRTAGQALAAQSPK